MSIFIFLLKIILIVLIVLLALIFMVLFIPVRYKIDGNYLKKKAEGKLEAGWLFGLIKLVISYDGIGKPKGLVRFMGVKVFDLF